MKPLEYDSSAPQHNAYHYSKPSLQGTVLKLLFQKNKSPSVLFNKLSKTGNQSLVCRHELPKLPVLFAVTEFWQELSPEKTAASLILPDLVIIAGCSVTAMDLCMRVCAIVHVICPCVCINAWISMHMSDKAL